MARHLLDLAALDLSRNVVAEAELRELVPHRDHFQLLDGICHFDPAGQYVVGYKDWPADAWWASGHIPGKPLMPGVLMIEGCAQAATFLIKKVVGWDANQFLGLGGVNDVRFRGQVIPPARVYFVAGPGVVSGRRLARYPTQAFCNGQLVMDMELLGVLL
ncbi:MAG: 3-hydroxyacyl-ACP dehydratase FabZ family protein [Planctomycetota bacterium]|jgi:3-hydroxyacyl-[acyl-carrier-protein] dehydratase|nr:beta-hydroxyacyl-ACP dehydratase [Planctomycetota bacterium]